VTSPHAHARTVAFQGAHGAFSHMACALACPELEPLPCNTFDEVFDAVEEGRACRAMIPVENSQAGRVVDIHRLLPERSLHIIGEHFHAVHHQLLAVPGATLADVRIVRSHPQALAQCWRYLRSRGLEAHAASDTAGAAKEVAALGDPRIGAIASTMAGRIYGLECLDSNIEDARGNTTRFLLMSREPHDPGPDTGPVITSCLFRVRNLPAALYKALGGFATNGVNLLKLESYQLGGFAWTQFSIDLEGHPEHPLVAHALHELRFFCEELRVLGTYRADPARQIAPAEPLSAR
jgi:prephenate dehydratase